MSQPSRARRASHRPRGRPCRPACRGGSRPVHNVPSRSPPPAFSPPSSRRRNTPRPPPPIRAAPRRRRRSLASARTPAPWPQSSRPASRHLESRSPPRRTKAPQRPQRPQTAILSSDAPFSIPIIFHRFCVSYAHYIIFRLPPREMLSTKISNIHNFAIY